jgi:uncharacterized protein YbjT (DUF2867 family)
MTSGTILVTGATGNVGAEVLRELVERGADVRAAALDDADAAKLPVGVPFALFDFDDPAMFGPALEGVDRVFLMRPPHMADAASFEPFLAAMRDAGVRQVAFLSLLGVEKNPVVPHHHIEKALKASGLGWTMLRPSFFMQNLTTTHLADLQRGVIVVPAGNGRTSFIHVRDIGAAAAVVLTEDGHLSEAYAITGSEALTYAQCADLLSDASGRPITYTRPGDRAFARHMKTQGFPPDFIKVMRGIYLICRLRMGGRVTDELPRLIGRPATGFADYAHQVAPLLNGA